MNNLPSVIGQAPSERPWVDWLRHLRAERDRVQRTMTFFHENAHRGARRKGSAKPKSQKAKAAKLDQIQKETGLSLEEIVAKVKELSAQ